MKTKFITTTALIALIAAGGVAATVSAQSAATATGLTEQQVIDIALLEVPGTVQEVELETEDGMQVYEIEILAADGTETEIEIAASTGEILEVDMEDGKDDDDDDDHDDEEEDQDDDDDQDDDEDEDDKDDEDEA